LTPLELHSVPARGPGPGLAPGWWDRRRARCSAPAQPANLPL